ncbi:hypothetical protein Pcinc_036027, partial [Petrolisthes cinctipes]
MSDIKAEGKSSAANPLEDLVNRLKPDKMSGRAMKYPYTFTAKLAAFPYQMYIKHVWLFRYYALGVLVSAPIFYKFQKMSCSPENVAKFEAKRLGVKPTVSLTHIHHLLQECVMMAGNKKPIGVNFEKILQSLQGDVENMRSEFNESGCPINDDSTHLHQFCERLEFFLTSGLRERGGLLGGRRDLWHYVCRCLADRRNIHDGLRVVKANTELKTGVGRVRCLVRYCLVHGCLGDVIQQCVENRGVTRQCYQDGAPLLHPTYAPALYSSLYNLSDLKFDLPPSGYDLDMAWPAFTRGGIGSWRPPSRTMSVSSLFSQ